MEGENIINQSETTTSESNCSIDKVDHIAPIDPNGSTNFLESSNSAQERDAILYNQDKEGDDIKDIEIVDLQDPI